MTPQANVLKGLISDHAVVVKLPYQQPQNTTSSLSSPYTCSNLIANPTHSIIIMFNSVYYVATLCLTTSCSTYSCVINTLMSSVIIPSEVSSGPDCTYVDSQIYKISFSVTRASQANLCSLSTRLLTCYIISSVQSRTMFHPA